MPANDAGAEPRLRARAGSRPLSLPAAQRGVAIVVLLALTGIVLIGALVVAVGGSSAAIRRDQQTALALAKARDALIARAASTFNRPGSLPCPDQNDDGKVTNPSDWNLSECNTYIGRLPWHTLDLDDLRDGYGERLWYVLTDTFRDDMAAGELNSDTPGALTVTGELVTSNVIAIIFSAGPPSALQDRTGAGLLLVSNYLDGENADGDTDYDSSGAVNDTLLMITRDALFSAVERRVAREARLCLEAFAASAGNRFPWAAPLSDLNGDNDASGTLTGRVPASLTNTAATLGTAVWPSSPFGGTCFTGGRWDHWRKLLLYHVAPDVAPDSATPLCSGSCLTVNGIPDVPAVVIVSGRALANPDQSGRPASATDVYLETFGSINNADGFGTGQYVQARPNVPATPGFNDVVQCAGTTAC
jgi:hypothetical protein